MSGVNHMTLNWVNIVVLAGFALIVATVIARLFGWRGPRWLTPPMRQNLVLLALALAVLSLAFRH